MAQCASCRAKIPFLEGVHIEETVFSSTLFSSRINGKWPGVSSKKVCIDCAVRFAIQISESFGAKSCEICREAPGRCAIPIDRKYLGLWKLGGSGNLGFICVGCSDKNKSVHVVNPDQWIETDESSEERHPWQDYIDDDPQFWDRLKD